MKFCKTIIYLFICFTLRVIYFLYCYDLILTTCIKGGKIKKADHEIPFMVKLVIIDHIPMYLFFLLLNQFFCGTVMLVISVIFILIECISFIRVIHDYHSYSTKSIDDFKDKINRFRKNLEDPTNDIEKPVEPQLTQTMKKNIENVQKTNSDKLKALDNLHELIEKLKAENAKKLHNTPDIGDTRTTSSVNKTPGGRAKSKHKKRKSRTRK